MNTASALRLPLEDIGNQIAQTYGGTIPKALGKAVPALKQLTEEQLKNGEALVVLGKAFDGRATAFANSDSGREAAALRDVAQAWTDIGKAMLPIERTLLPGIVTGFQAIATLSDANIRGSLSTSGLVGNFLSAHGIEVVGLNDQPPDKSAQDQASGSFAGRERADLDAEAKDALSRQGGIQAELQDVELHGLEETNKKREAEVARSTEEEFKQRVIGLQEYLSTVDQAMRR